MPESSRQLNVNKGASPYTRERLSLIALLIIALAGVGLTALVAGPFIPGLTWGFSFAVVAWPIYGWVHRHIRHKDLAAGLSVALVGLVLVGPAVLIAWQVGNQAREAGQLALDQLQSDKWKDQVGRFPQVSAIWNWLESNIDVKQAANDLAGSLRQRAAVWIRSAIWGTTQILIALFALFYFFRDSQRMLKTVRSTMPLSERETNYFFERVRTMTHATVYGTLAVAFIQGLLGGTMFWILKVPGALLWGVAMGLLSIIPTLGAFIVWLPAAAFLMLQGNWGRALILTAWGMFVVGLIDNLLYPVLVGKEMRLHTLPVFIVILGGLIVFGAAGLVLGPVILAATVAILDILRSRTAQGRSAEQPT